MEGGDLGIKEGRKEVCSLSLLINFILKLSNFQSLGPTRNDKGTEIVYPNSLIKLTGALRLSV